MMMAYDGVTCSINPQSINADTTGVTDGMLIVLAPTATPLLMRENRVADCRGQNQTYS
jgi:hypothetical protein